MDSRYFIKMIFIFTPLESPAIYSGDDINKASIPSRKGVVKALSFLTGFTFLVAILSGCPAPVWVSKEPPAPLDQFLSSKWGDSIEDVKKAIDRDGNKWFKDSTDQWPYTLYASGNYLENPAIFSYFFTPKSKKLYRVDVTFSDLRIYGKAKNVLIQKFQKPSYSQLNIDHWSWDNKSLIILQKNTTHVQISYSNGPLLIHNQEEGGLIKK